MNQRDIERERDRILKAAGFHDIEAPSGIIQRRQVLPTTEANAAREEEYFARALAFLGRHRFANELERLVWTAHAQRKGRRVVAREVGVYPKYVDEVVARLKAVMDRPRRGRPKGHAVDSLRGEGITLRVRLSPAHVRALSHVMSLLKAPTASEAARRALMLVSRRINGGTG